MRGGAVFARGRRGGNLRVPGALSAQLLPLTLAVVLAWPTPVQGQVVGEGPDRGHPPGAVLKWDPAPELLTPAPLRVQEEPVSTRAVFIRAFLVPGWGHVMTESYFRGGFWVAAQGGSWWMLWKSVSRRKEARRLRDVEMDIVMDRYRAQGVMDPDSLRVLAEGDPAMEAWDTLLDRRGEQVEDWVALSIFVVLLGAVDAFVSAHLMDFPEPLALDVGPRQGVPLDIRRPGVEVRFSVASNALRDLLPLRRAP